MFFDIHGARPQIARDGIHTIAAVGDSAEGTADPRRPKPSRELRGW